MRYIYHLSNAAGYTTSIDILVNDVIGINLAPFLQLLRSTNSKLNSL